MFGENGYEKKKRNEKQTMLSTFLLPFSYNKNGG